MNSANLLPSELRLFAGTSLFLLLGWVLHLIRRRGLGLRESLLWLVSTSAALLLVLFPALLLRFAQILHVQVPANALFAAAFLYVLANLLSTTIAVAHNAARARRLSQECAILRAEIGELRRALKLGSER